jgi:hypothetical protein
MGQKGSRTTKEGAWDQQSPLMIPRASMQSVVEGEAQANWPAALKANQEIMSDEETLTASLLVGLDQQHLFKNWEPPGLNDDKKHAFFRQIKDLSTTYLPEEGGLIAYINNARALLRSSKKGVNPLDGWTPEVPTAGTYLEPFTPEYDRFEQVRLITFVDTLFYMF